MNGGSYLKFILTLLTLAVIVFGYLGVSALDRLHRVNVKLLEKLNTPSAVSAAVPETVQKAMTDYICLKMELVKM